MEGVLGLLLSLAAGTVLVDLLLAETTSRSKRLIICDSIHPEIGGSTGHSWQRLPPDSVSAPLFFLR